MEKLRAVKRGIGLNDGGGQPASRQHRQINKPSMAATKKVPAGNNAHAKMWDEWMEVERIELSEGEEKYTRIVMEKMTPNSQIYSSFSRIPN